MGSDDVASVRQLAEENVRLKRIVAEQTLDLDAYKILIEKKRLGPSQRKDEVRALKALGFSERRACRILSSSRSLAHYQLRRPLAAPTLERLRALAARHRRFGYRRLGVLLRREGTVVNHKRLYRIYAQDGLAVPMRRKRHVRYERGQAIEEVTSVDQRWSVDFLSRGYAEYSACK